MTEKLRRSDSLTRMKRTIKEFCEVTGCKDELLVYSLCTWNKIRDDLTSDRMRRALCVNLFAMSG